MLDYIDKLYMVVGFDLVCHLVHHIPHLGNLSEQHVMFALSSMDQYDIYER